MRILRASLQALAVITVVGFGIASQSQTCSVVTSQPPAATKQEAGGVVQTGNPGPLVKLSTPAPAPTHKILLRAQANTAYNGDDLTKELPFGLERGHSSPTWVGSLELPVRYIHLIIVAKVMSAVACLSSDRRAISSTFSVEVERVLLDKKDIKLKAGDKLDVERFGGRLMLPSGKINDFHFYHERMPIIGRRYMFFLWQTPGKVKWSRTNGEGWMLRTGYLIHDGKVFGLDGTGDDPRSNAYTRFNGKPLSDLKTALEAKIAKQANSQHSKQ